TWRLLDVRPRRAGRLGASDRVEPALVDHRFALAARLAQGLGRPEVLPARQLLDEAIERLVETIADELVRMRNVAAVAVHDRDHAAMTHALGDHQPVDAIGGEVLHVAVQEARAFRVEDAIAITNHGANRGAGAVDA